MSKKLVVGIVIAAVLALGVTFPKGNTVVERVVNQVSGVSSLDGVDNPYVTIAGNKSANFGIPVAATSSIVCSVRNPFSGTSTLSNFRMGVITNGGLGAQTFDLSTSTTQLGSSTLALIANYKAPASSFGTVWSPTTVGNHPQVGPGLYVNVRIATATPSAFTTYWTGTCSGEFLAL